MTEKDRPLRLFLPAVLVYAAGFAAAGLWDLAVDRAVYTPNSLFAIMVECFGWYPAFLPALFLLLLLVKRAVAARAPVWQPLACGLAAAGGFVALYYASYGDMVARGLLSGPEDFSAWLWLAAGVLLAGILAAAAWGLPRPAREKMLFFGLVGGVYMLANQALIYPLKLLWSRTRFDDMLAAGSFEHFTPWWRPLGFGGSSFPSGHTANAAGILMLLVLCDLFPAWAVRRKWVLAGCWAYIGLVAFGRVLIGRHFVSDTLAASGLMALLFYALRHNKYYRRGLAGALERAAVKEDTADAV